ncbi:hypothetical protein HYALB_00005849 [Hymenoscyphus albidus]|uniref:Uncharacterized protein n=1 Tax=Hymenoscyphus albidus TaxID=595503 RepID=A0A9N9QAJ3_9HELO|nr:hypothetical protein HYALB_00005849 [Hymenoscyphus albidus]
MATKIVNLATTGSTTSKSSDWAAHVDAHAQAANQTIAGPLATFYTDAGGHSPESEKANEQLKNISLFAAFSGLQNYKHISDLIEGLRWHTGGVAVVQEDWTKTFSYSDTFKEGLQKIITDTTQSAIAVIDKLPEKWKHAAAELYKASLDILADFLHKTYAPLKNIRRAQADIKAGKWGIIEKGKDAIDVLYKEAVEKLEDLHSHE